MSDIPPSDGPPHPLDDEAAIIAAILEADPDEAIQRLRDEPEHRLLAARADVAPTLRGWFRTNLEDRTRGWHENPSTSAAGAPPMVGVEWSFDARHDEPTFDGLRATGREVTVRGVTLFVVEDGQLVVRRYIDWIGLYAQLGLTVNWRVPIVTIGEGERPPEPAAPREPRRGEEQPARRRAASKKAASKKAAPKKAAPKKAAPKKAASKKAASKKAASKKAASKKATTR